MSAILGDFLTSLRGIGRTGFQLGKSFVIDENGKVIPTSDISGSRVGYPSKSIPAESPQMISRTNNPPLRNLVKPLAATTAVTSIAVGGTLVAINPGVQQTVQQVSQNQAGTLQSLSDALKTTAGAGASATNFLTGNPLILIGILALGAIVILKK